MRILLGVGLLIFMISCTKDSTEEDTEVPGENPKTENTSPPEPRLIYPSDNLLCIDSEVTFQWSQVSDPDQDAVSYSVEIATDRAFTNPVESRVLNTNSIKITLDKGNDYYWRVSAKDDKEHASAFTPSNAFYVEGEPTGNYIPFVAKAIFPLNNAQVKEKKIFLEWKTTDLDGDALSYDLYFGEGYTTALIAEKLTETRYEVILAPNTLYSWRVSSSDESSTSLGDLWIFRTEN